MPRFSLSISTTREVVVNAKNLQKATTKALTYARDCFPSTTFPLILASTQVPDTHTSKTSDDADDIPRDS